MKHIIHIQYKDGTKQSISLPEKEETMSLFDKLREGMVRGVIITSTLPGNDIWVFNTEHIAAMKYEEVSI